MHMHFEMLKFNFVRVEEKLESKSGVKCLAYKCTCEFIDSHEIADSQDFLIQWQD